VKTGEEGGPEEDYRLLRGSKEKKGRFKREELPTA